MKKIKGKIIWGILLIIVGIIWATNALELTHIDIFFDGWWTLFLIVPSFVGLFESHEKTGSLLCLLIGIALFLACNGVFRFDLIFRLIVPLIVIAIGVRFLLAAHKDRHIPKGNDDVPSNSTINNDNMKNDKKSANINILDASAPTAYNISDHMYDSTDDTTDFSEKRQTEEVPGNQKYDKHKQSHRICATFSSQKIDWTGEIITTADVSAVFGGVECDLRGAQITPHAVINLSAVFGGITLHLPKSVQVKSNVTPLFGGVDNKHIAPPTADSSVPTVYLTGECIFGGIEIK